MFQGKSEVKTDVHASVLYACGALWGLRFCVVQGEKRMPCTQATSLGLLALDDP